MSKARIGIFAYLVLGVFFLSAFVYYDLMPRNNIFILTVEYFCLNALSDLFKNTGVPPTWTQMLSAVYVEALVMTKLIVCWSVVGV